MVRIRVRFAVAFFLIVVSGTAAFSAVPAVTNLSAGTASVSAIPLSWSVSSGGPATAYEVRYSTVPLAADTFSSAIPLGGVPAPSGGVENYTVNGLACGTKYWFALKAYDAAHSGGLSNVISAVTAACAPSFATSTTISGASSLYAFTRGDFNNDCRQDLAFTVGSGSTGHIVSYPGDGAGGFGSPTTTTGVTGNYPLVPSAGDFNRDGRLDLVVPNFFGDSVSLLIGNGSGGFTSNGTISTGDEPQNIVVNDFNRDGKPDLAVALWGGHALAVYLGDGNGGFTHKGNYGGYGSDSRLHSARAADMDGDGSCDLVVADYGITETGWGNTVGFLKGKGDGSFEDAITYTVGRQPGDISVGDLNGDGRSDLVVVSSLDNHVAVLIGSGNGVFAPATLYAQGNALNSSQVADYNGDGKPDILVGSGSGGNLMLLSGKGDGTFGSPQSFPVAAPIRQVVSDDFNGDGKPDAVVLASDQATVISVLNTTTWSPAGNFMAAPSLATGANPSSMKTADLNGDGRLDLVTSNEVGNSASVFYGNGDGTFQAAVPLSAGFSPDALSIADFNRDGRPDLLLINDSSSVYRYDNNGSGFSGPASLPFGINNDDVISADINRDGIPDLVLVYNNTTAFSWAAVHLGNGDGSFGAETAYTAGSYANSVTAGDFNRDGLTDLATGNFDGNNISILLGKSDGTFHGAVNYPAGANPITLATADLNRDGKPDLAVPNYGGTTVSVLMGNGDGTFQEKTDYEAGANPQTVVVGDMDRDGRPDLVVASRGGSSISVLRGRGDGSFLPAEEVTAGSSPIYPALGDFNGDGKPDMAVANYNSSTVSILLNTAPLPTVPQQGLAALWRAENNPLDSIGGNHGTLQNGATFAVGRYGQAFNLGGTAYVQTPGSVADFGSAPFTVDFWMYATSDPPSDAYLVGKSHPDGGLGWDIRFDDKAIKVCGVNGWGFNVVSDASVALNSWHHIAVTSSGDVVTLYIDGVVKGTSPRSSISSTGNPFRIGYTSNYGGSGFNGLIDEVAIHNRALPAAEIAALSGMTPNGFSFTPQSGMPLSRPIISNPITVTGITASSAISIAGGAYAISTNDGATWSEWTEGVGSVGINDRVMVRLNSSPSYSALTTATLTIGGVSGAFNVTTAAAGDPAADGLVAWWRGDNNAFDSIGGNHGTPQGGVSYSAAVTRQAFSFHGGSDSVNIPAFNTGNDWTIEGWLYPVGASDGMHHTFFSRSNGNQDGITINYLGAGHSAANQIGVAIGANGSWQLLSYSGTPYPPNSWYHVAFSKNGDTYTLYVNGQIKNQQTVAGVSNDYQTRAINLGHWNYGVSLDGLIDEVQIYNRPLSATEVAKTYGIVPDQFTFAPVTGAPLSSAVDSGSIVVTGTSHPTTITVSGGQYQVNGGAWTSSAGMVDPGATVKMRLTSSAGYSATMATTLTIGGVAGSFTVTTLADTEKPLVTSFTLASTESTAMTVGITSFIATDIDQVSGYLVTDSATPPAADHPDWLTTAPATVILSRASDNLLHAWARDPAGNVSEPLTAAVLLRPVRRDSGKEYVSLQTACGEAGSGETLNVLAVTLPESLFLSGEKDLTIRGGYDDGYNVQNGYSTIQGTLTVNCRSLTVTRIIVR